MKRLLNIANKKIPLGICVSAVFVSAALAYSVSYTLAMRKFNKVVSYNYEKQQMYSKLSEVDHAIRQEYFGDINEDDLINNICNGYIHGLNQGDCKYLSSEEYKEFISGKEDKNEAVKTQRIDDIGYLKLQGLSAEAGNLFVSNFQSLQADGVNKFIIDVRGLKGGSSDQLAKIVNFLFPAGDIVSYVEKSGERGVEFKSTSSGVSCNISVVCNEETAGLSEVLVSALKDFSNAKVVGQKTAGTALKMKTLQLSDGSVIMFPTAHYITKDGNSLYGMGVNPDEDVALDEDKSRLLNNSQLSLEDDDQVLKAMEMLG